MGSNRNKYAPSRIKLSNSSSHPRFYVQDIQPSRNLKSIQKMMHEAAPCLSTSSTTEDSETTATSSFPLSFINNFQKSHTPSRILFFENNNWIDFPDTSFQKLRDGFVAGRSIQEIEMEGRHYAIDFRRMVQIDLKTRVANPIGWIDFLGQCFFPVKYESPDQDIAPKFPGAEELRESDRLYNVVEKLFINGMKRDASNATVKKVYRCVYSSDLEKMRLKTFHITSEMVKAVRGDANVRFGWFGGSSEEIAEAVKHGFGRSNYGAHGVGVHLSSPHFPFKSSLMSEEDANGERHIVLCRVIMGESERVEAGSLQYNPSSDDYDSAVDDLANPKWYVIWNAHMNTHILPEYIVTFKSTMHVRQVCKVSRRRQTAVTGFCFQKLLVEIGSCLPYAKLRCIEGLYDKYLTGRMRKDVFIRYLRSMAGDKLLASAIRKIKGC